MIRFPISPFLFRFIVEGLRKLIHCASREGKIKGVKMSQIIKITHFLFVDDVILFGEGPQAEWHAYKDILDMFCNARGILISESKSTMLENRLEEEVLNQIPSLFPYEIKDLNLGFKYLGYNLKPNCYQKVDWIWLL